MSPACSPGGALPADDAANDTKVGRRTSFLFADEMVPRAAVIGRYITVTQAIIAFWQKSAVEVAQHATPSAGSMGGKTLCPGVANPHGSSLERLCVSDVPKRESELRCMCWEGNMPVHMKGEWCAADNRKSGTLFGTVRVYLEYLWNTGQLTDEMDVDKRKAVLWPAYAFLVWMTDAESFKAKGRRVPQSLLKDGIPKAWLAVIRSEAKGINVPPHAPDGPVRDTLQEIALLSRSKQPLLQASTALQPQLQPAACALLTPSLDSPRRPICRR